MELPTYLSGSTEETRLEIYVQPGAARVGIAGVHGNALKLKVRAPAREGQANDAVIEFLSDVLGVAKSYLEITSGHSSRHKRVSIAGLDASAVAARLSAAQPS